jgi:AcrR family transcriptional regulator
MRLLVDYNHASQYSFDGLTDSVDYIQVVEIMMKVSETDPRSIRTREKLRFALIDLVSRRHSSILTVQDITQEAGINRTTFYLHYQGVHELIEDCANTLFDELREGIYSKRPLAYRNDAIALMPFVESVFNHLEKHELFYRAVLGKQGDPMFRGLFRDVISELVFEPVIAKRPGKALESELEMILGFFSDGSIGIAIWWLENGRPISAERAALLVARDILPAYVEWIRTKE